MWSYAATDWLKLTEPSQSDKTRSRWPVHPLWAALASIDWMTQGGPLLRSYAPTRAPSKEWVARRALSAIASFGALVGAKDFDLALDATADAAFAALSNQSDFNEVAQTQMFAEKVESLSRKYNTALNGTPPVVVEPDPVAREYRRQTRGV